MKTVQLIVTADDYGVTADVSRGIREAIAYGNVSCTSVMMNYVSEQDIQSLLALKRDKDFGIGLHMNLTEGLSLSTCKEFNRDQLNDLRFVQTEMRMQITKFHQIFGQMDHINFHQHSHYDLRVLQEFLPIEEVSAIPVRFVNRLMKEILTGAQRKIPARFINIFPFFSHPETFFSHLQTELLSLINDCCLTEWMVHPGYSSPELEAMAPNYAVRRETELALLCSAQLTSFIEDQRVELVSFQKAFYE